MILLNNTVTKFSILLMETEWADFDMDIIILNNWTLAVWTILYSNTFFHY